MAIIDSSSDVCTQRPCARALPLVQRDEDADGEVEPGRQVGDRDADARRLGAGQPGDAHQPAHALGDLVDAAPVGVRPVLAEAGEGRVDQPGVARGARSRSRSRGGTSPPGACSRRARRRRRPGAAAARRPRAASGRCRWRACCGGGSGSPSRGVRRRRRPADSGSTRTTSAPQSASWRTHVGPARAIVRSRTRRSARGNPSAEPSSSEGTSPGCALAAADRPVRHSPDGHRSWSPGRVFGSRRPSSGASAPIGRRVSRRPAGGRAACGRR